MAAPACSALLDYVAPIEESGPALCTNERDDDLDGNVDAEQEGCSPFWPVPVALAAPPQWACLAGRVADAAGTRCVSAESSMMAVSTTCPEGWRAHTLASPDGTAASIDVPVVVCEPIERGSALPAGCDALAPVAGAAYVAVGATEGDGSLVRPFGSISAALASGATDLWLAAGDYEEPAAIAIAAGANVSIGAACDAWLGRSGQSVLDASGATTFRGVNVRGDVTVEPGASVVISSSVLEAATEPIALRANVGGIIELRDVVTADHSDGSAAPIHIELEPTAQVSITASSLGVVGVKARNARVQIERSSIWAGSEPAVEASGSFASIEARAVNVRRAVGVVTRSPLVLARDGADVSVAGAYLTYFSGGAIALSGGRSEGELADLVADAVNPPPSTLPDGAPAISATAGASLTLTRVAVLRPASDAVAAQGAATQLTLTDATVFLDSRLAATTDDLPATTAAVRADDGACVTADRLYIEGVDGRGVALGGDCRHELAALTVERVRARGCHDGLRNSQGIGVFIAPGTRCSVSRFLIRRTNGCAFYYDPARSEAPTEGALIENVGGICTFDGLRPPVPADVVFRDNGGDYSIGSNNCFASISVGCPTRLDMCP